MLELLTFILALATVALAVATVWSTREQGWREERRAVRAALLEQYSNARRWHAGRLVGHSNSAAQLAATATPTDAIRSLVIAVDMGPQLTAYLVWLSDRTDRYQTEYTKAYPESKVKDRARHLWMAELENLQTILQLVSLFASSRWHLRGASQSFTDAAWLLPHAGPPNFREESRREEEAQGNRPPFPTDPIFAPASPLARGVAAYGSEQALQAARSSPGLVGPATRGYIPPHQVPRRSLVRHFRFGSLC